MSIFNIFKKKLPWYMRAGLWIRSKGWKFWGALFGSFFATAAAIGAFIMYRK